MYQNYSAERFITCILNEFQKEVLQNIIMCNLGFRPNYLTTLALNTVECVLTPVQFPFYFICTFKNQ